MTIRIAMTCFALALFALPAVAEPPPVEVLPPAPLAAPPAPVVPLPNPFPPPAAAGAPSCPPPAPPQRRRLFHGRLRERVRALLHLGCGPS